MVTNRKNCAKKYVGRSSMFTLCNWLFLPPSITVVGNNWDLGELLLPHLADLAFYTIIEQSNPFLIVFALLIVPTF